MHLTYALFASENLGMLGVGNVKLACRGRLPAPAWPHDDEESSSHFFGLRPHYRGGFPSFTFIFS